MGAYEVVSDAQVCTTIALEHMEMLSIPTPSGVAKSFVYDLYRSIYGAAHENRTHDLRFTRATLYRLS